jgi:hypothetical protein
MISAFDIKIQRRNYELYFAFFRHVKNFMAEKIMYINSQIEQNYANYSGKDILEFMAENTA